MTFKVSTKLDSGDCNWRFKILKSEQAYQFSLILYSFFIHKFS